MPPRLHRQSLVIVPGIHDSGPEHWQTLWESAHPDAHRIRPGSFDLPELADWVRAIDTAIRECASPPVLVCHSLGCLAALAWAAGRPASEHVAGALLVAVPDPSGPQFPADARSFTGVVPTPLGVPSELVASSDDPYGSEAYARQVADRTGARMWLAGAVGHLNVASGLGDWPEGQRLLADLIGA